MSFEVLWFIFPVFLFSGQFFVLGKIKIVTLWLEINRLSLIRFFLDRVWIASQIPALVVLGHRNEVHVVVHIFLSQVSLHKQLKSSYVGFSPLLTFPLLPQLLFHQNLSYFQIFVQLFARHEPWITPFLPVLQLLSVFLVCFVGSLGSVSKVARPVLRLECFIHPPARLVGVNTFLG